MSHPANSLGIRLGYASGTLSFAVKDVAFGSFVLFYYVTVVGLQGTLAGAVIFLSLLWDAVTDPIVGSLSDNLRSRWGRRHPFMALSGVPLAASLYALFSVPEGLNQGGVFLWMLASCLVLRTFLTLFTVPYLALGAELSRDYQERSSIAGLRTLIGWFSAILFTAFAWGVIFQGNDTTDGRLIRDNYHAFAVLSFALIALFTTLSTATTASRIASLPKVAELAQRFSVRRIVEDIQVALRNDNFRNLFWLLLTLGVATGLNAALGTHMNTYFWELTTAQLTVQALGTLGVVGLLFIFMNLLNRRFEKQQVLKLCILGLVVNTLWFVPGRLLGWIPDNGHPVVFPLVLVHGYISAIFVIWFQTVSASAIADISDEQELQTERRQEGVFFAAQGFSIKFVTGIGNLLGGVIIDLIRLPVGAVPGTVADPVLFKLGLVMGPVIAVFLFIPYRYARRLTLSRERHEAVRAALDQREQRSDRDRKATFTDPAPEG